MPFREISVTGWPGMPMMEDVQAAPVATMLENETFFSSPAAGTFCPRPRRPRRRKMGARIPTMVMFDTTTRSMLPPSTVSIETPALGYGFAPSGRAEIVQLRNTMFLKSPLDSVPSLRALRTWTSAQSVTIRVSVDRRAAQGGLGFAPDPAARRGFRHVARPPGPPEAGLGPAGGPVPMAQARMANAP